MAGKWMPVRRDPERYARSTHDLTRTGMGVYWEAGREIEPPKPGHLVGRWEWAAGRYRSLGACRARCDELNAAEAERGAA